MRYTQLYTLKHSESVMQKCLRQFALASASALVLGCATPSSKPQADADWTHYGRDLAGQRFSPLTQINTSNVHQLKEAWRVNTGVKATFQATPIVQNGIMYVALPFNHVLALNAKTGQEIWRYTHDRRKDWQMCCGPANRGVAVANGKVFIGTVDARLIALNAQTGQKEWDINVVESDIQTEGQDALNQNDPNSKRKVTGGTGVGMAMAPIVYRNKVIIGITGVGYGLHIDNPTADAPLGAVIGVTGRFGRPGFLAAYDINNGQRVWQFDTIPSQGWEGQFAETIDGGIRLNRDIAKEKADLANYPDAASYGGGSAWTTPAIDANTNTLYFGTGNPSPQMNDVSRPGDNLYTVSLVALDTETGQRKWHYQQVPHDLWGYDLASPPVLFDYIHQGKPVPAVGQASKLGWFYIHDRTTGALLKKSAPFVPQQNLFQKPSFDGVVVYPGILGGSNWSPASVDQAQQRAYVAAIHAPIRYTLHETPSQNGQAGMRYSASEPTKDPRWGLLSAINLSTGQLAWQVKTAQPLVGGVLATQGGLVFTGEGNGNLNAYHNQTGQLLWQAQSAYGVNAPPITYQIDGVQYLAVVSGGNAIFGYPQGDAILVYQLPR
jgi:glucose dehydrogenase